MLPILAKLFIYGVLFLSLVAALGVVLLPNIFHAALCLVGTLLGIAALYLALQAEFIAVVQVLLYVGAVMTLVIFAIMLTHRIGDMTIPQTNKQSLPACLALFAFVVLIGGLLLKTDWSILVGTGGSVASVNPPVDTFMLGKALLGEYVFPFEVVSVILIAGLIGAIVVARKD
ncbi:MAG: NADH-quinone oxidoreductase subunit J [Candidatus Omnitrophica bacterium]|nr:NADH-quinone oxidoreductase subunit J [Candidatus Omnitrophota bacterium]